jgi:hypothetical protein
VGDDSTVRRMVLDGSTWEVEYVADRDDGDYGTVWLSVRAHDDGPEACFSLILEEVPWLMSTLGLVIDDWKRERSVSGPMRDASWIR